MFFSKSIIAAATVFLGLTLQAHAHAGVTPALGVSGNFARNNVQRPSNAKPCGNINIAQAFDSSTAITAAADGTFTATITNFNGGVDGSRQVTARVDPTGTGKSFTAATVVKNGDRNPTSTGSQQLVVQMPAGVTCVGGATKNKCLVSFTTAGGFGNCAVVQAAGAATGNRNNAAAAAAGTTNASAGNATGKNRARPFGRTKFVAAVKEGQRQAQPQIQVRGLSVMKAEAKRRDQIEVRGLKMVKKAEQPRDVDAVGTRAARALRRAASNQA